MFESVGGLTIRKLSKAVLHVVKTKIIRELLYDHYSIVQFVICHNSKNKGVLSLTFHHPEQDGASVPSIALGISDVLGGRGLAQSLERPNPRGLRTRRLREHGHVVLAGSKELRPVGGEPAGQQPRHHKVHKRLLERVDGEGLG